MLKTISALAFAAATITAPAFAQDVKAPVAPVADLSSKGLAGAGAYVVGGVAIVGIAAIAIVASDDDDNTSSTPTSGN